MLNYSYKYAIVALIVFVACGQGAQKDTDFKVIHNPHPSTLYPWNMAAEVCIFSFELKGSSQVDRRLSDPMKLLNNTIAKSDKFILKQSWKGSIQAGNDFMDTCFKGFKATDTIWTKTSGSGNETEESVAMHDCGFMPHHCICFLDKSGRVVAYELVCFTCAARQPYGAKAFSNGNIASLYRFCQFHGLDFELDNMDALHTFATASEIKCLRLRKYPDEKLDCKGN